MSTRLTHFFCTASHSQGSPASFAQSLTLTHATPAPVLSRCCACIPEVPLGLVHLGFHFGRVLMRSVLMHSPFRCTNSIFHAYYAAFRDFQELRVYSATPLGLSNAPGIPFRPRCRVFRGSGTREYKAHPLLLHSLSLSRLTRFFRTVSYSHACNSSARAFPVLRVYSRGSTGSSAPGIPFWPRSHAFRGSVRREYKAHSLP